MMRALHLSELEEALEATLHGNDCEFGSVEIDSRRVHPGDLFVALAGERFDGHDYLRQAGAAGATAALLSRGEDCGLPCLQVTDTRRALGLLGGYNRQLFAGPLVAITGSSGKTTAKNLVHSVLSQRGETLATEGNFNNEIGVPLTLLRLEPRHRFAVVEMGAARAGDISWLCQLGQPGVALLLNAMPAHLEGFGTVDDVAAAKGEIFDRLGAGDTAVINADQRWAPRWRARAGDARIIDFALDGAAAVSAHSIQDRALEGSSFIATTPAGEVPVRLQLPGRHNIANALAAIAVGLACELTLEEIAQGLSRVQPVAGRLESRRGQGGCRVVDDCYNANPGSVSAAIDLLAGCSGRRTLVLGAMRELGSGSARLHRQMGEYARQAGIDQLWGVGEELLPAVEAFGVGGRYFADRAAVLAELENQFDESDTVLVKGSRSAGMEQVLGALAPGEPGDN